MSRNPQERLKATAVNFWAAAMQLNPMISALNLDKPPSGANVAQVSVVCYAFSIEAYFKCLLKKHGIHYSGIHNLFDLFENLPDTLRKEIAKEMSSQNMNFKTEADFMMKLKHHSNAFVDWRYLFENKKSSGTITADRLFLQELAKLLNHICELAD